MLKPCPDPVDVQDLQFKLHCRLKVFNNNDLSTFPKFHSLISCASRYGLLFVGTNTSNLQVIQIKCVESYSPKDKDIANYPRRHISLPAPPQHINVNCDSTILAVVMETNNCATVFFFDVLSFLKDSISVLREVRLSSTPGIFVREVGWNPSLPFVFTACKSDGTLGVYEIKEASINVNELPSASEATCFCWSPKGKQISVGSKNGKITQYKPDLKAVKVVNEPPLEGSYTLISLQWVSNYQFIGIYQSNEPEGRAKLIVVDAPKTGSLAYTNYEDVCYSGSSRLPQFYMALLQQWNILMVASSNSTELGVLGSVSETWTQWIISDSARAELPLSIDHQETLPVGLAVDVSSTRPLPWSESTIPPCPYLLILSHHGVLCLFSVINLKEGMPTICTPPDPISDLSGVKYFSAPTETIPQVAEDLSKANAGPIVSSVDSYTANQGPQFMEPSNAAVRTRDSTVTDASKLMVQNYVPNQPLTFGAKTLTQPQPTYAASGSLFGGKPAESKPLFGGQLSLTPIKPQQSPMQPQSQTSMASAHKQQQMNTATDGSLTQKYSAIFSALNAPTAAVSSAQTKSIVVPALQVPKLAPPAVQPTIVQPKVNITPAKPAEPSKMAVDAKIKEETDILLAHIIRDECVSLESELKALLHQGRMLNINIGSENEKVDLVRKIKCLQDFIKEIVDISVGENAEVHYLKQNLMESWAWYEEARSRYIASKDETVSLLLRSQPLDSATEKRQTDIRKMMYYIESQISQASKALDEQWDNFQDYAKKVHRTKMPTMEAIFQAMVRQSGILQRQSYILKDISSRLKARGAVSYVPSLLLSVENTKDLEDSLNRLQIGHSPDVYKLQYERVLNRIKSLSKEKTKKLRELLKNREVLHVAAVKPHLNSSLILQSPESKSRRLLSNLANLGSPMSAPAVAPKASSFVHSTPIRELKAEIKLSEGAPSATQSEPKSFSFKKVEKSSLVAQSLSANTFVPLSKSASVFANLPQEGASQAPLVTHVPSAFAPTQGNFGKFSFTSSTPATVTTPTMKVATTATVFSFSPAGSDVPKFGMSAPRTPVATDLSKPSTQFSFGNSLSITTVKTDITNTVTTSANLFGMAARPTFNLSAIGTKSSAGTNSPTVCSETSNSENNFAMGATSKLSAFSVVTSASNVPHTVSSSATNVENLSKSLFTHVSTPTTVLASGLTITSTTFPKASLMESTTASVSSTTTSTFGSSTATSKGFSVFQTSVTEVTGTSLQPMNKSILTFGNQQSTITGSTVSSTPAFSIFTTSKTTSVSSVTQGFTLGGAQNAASASSTSPSTLVFSSSASNITKPSISATAQQAAPIISQSSISTTSSSVQPSIFSTFGDLATTVSQPSSSGAVTQSSISGGSVTSGASITTQVTSIFGSAKTTLSSQPSVFDSAITTSVPPSIFGGAQGHTTVGSSSSQSTPLFGSTKISSSQTSIFGSPVTTTPTFFGTTQSITATTTHTTSIFNSGNIISPSQTSTFGGTTSSAKTSVFGSNTPKTTSTSIFGSAPAGGVTQSSIFGNSLAPTNTVPTQSVFGTQNSNQQGSIFGEATSTNTVFGPVPSVAVAQSSIFGAKGATTSSSIFGVPQPSTTQKSIFATSTVPSTQTSIFGAPTTSLAPSFGTPFGTSSTASPAFGQSSTGFGVPKTTASTFGTAFGNSSGFGMASTTSSIFGQPATFGSPPTSVFGTPSSTANAFGSPSTFGATTSNVFAAPVSSAPSSFSFVGASSNTSSSGAFGFGSLNVGSPVTTNSAFAGSTGFGQQTMPSNPFSTTEQKFGASSGSVFGSPTSSSGSLFGSNTGSTFSSNTQSGFGTANFGSPSTFGQQSTFGQSSFGNASFGNVQPGPFSSGSGAVSQTGFGSPASFPKPSGFGSSPVFGGSPTPAFGAAPSFGGAPAFGAAPAFGSPNKIFGGNTPSAGFGSASASNAGFGSLATQNTVGFGNLAQQASSPNSTGFSGSSSFSSWR